MEGRPVETSTDHLIDVLARLRDEIRLAIERSTRGTESDIPAIFEADAILKTYGR